MAEILKLPSLIDGHVHFRTPGQEYKESFESGSRAAYAGGVTTVLDMPNNTKLIVDRELLERKMKLAAEQSHCDIGFYLGTMGEPDQDYESCMDYVFGVKVYLSKTTGGYTVTDPKKLENIFRRWDCPKPILVHAEGETLEKALSLAQKYNRRIHVCHLSLAAEVHQIADAKNKRGENMVTGEVTPHHLFESSFWSADAYHQMKPPLSDLKDMQVLWDGLTDGTIDSVATDHAPHSKEEKESDNPPCGVTGLETTLPVLLMAERVGKITLNRIVEVTHTNPIKIFDLAEEADTYIEVARNEPWEIRGELLQTEPKWTPFEGRRVLDKVQKVTVRGKVVYENGEILSEPGSGRVLYAAEA